MKHLLFTILLSSLCLMLNAQQDLFKYQAVARDASGTILTNHNISLRFNILEDDSNQTLWYSETHNMNTNDLGIFHLNIGAGTVMQGMMSAIDWSAADYLLNIEADYSGGDNFIDLGSIPFLSVPYALHAKTVEDKDDADADPSNEIQSLSINGSQLTISGGNTINLPTGGMGGGNDEDPNNEIQDLSAQQTGNMIQLEISLGNGTSFSIDDADADPNNEIQTLNRNGLFVELSKGGGSFQDMVDDLDSDPNNELQSLSKSGKTVSLSNGGGSFTDEVDDADADASNELQSLSINGSQLTISNGNTINLPTGGGGGSLDEDPNNEIQTLTKNGENINLSLGGGTVNIRDADFDTTNEIQTLSKNGELIELSLGGGSVDIRDADADSANELQMLTISGNQLSISNGNTINLPTGGGGGGNDEDPNNEIQVLSRNGTNVELSLSGGSVNIEDGDADPTNEIQSLTKSGNIVNLSNGGSFTDEVDDADSDATNEIQTMFRNGNDIELSHGGGIVNIQDADSDIFNEIQSLSLTGNTLDISGGNSLDLSPIASKWEDDGVDQIKYEGAARVIHPVDSNIRSTMEPGFFEVNNLFGNAFIDGSNLDFTNVDPGNTWYTRYGYDGVAFDQPSIGLLLPQYTYLTSFGLEMDNSVERATFNNYGVYLEDAVNVLDMRIDNLLMRKDDGAQSFYDAANFACDSISYKNAGDWNTASLGTNDTGNGFLRIYEGGNNNVSIELGKNEYFDPRIGLFQNGEKRVVVETFMNTGIMSTFDDNAVPNTYIGSTYHNSSHGQMLVQDAGGFPRAGLQVDTTGSGAVYADGEFRITNTWGTPLSISDDNGYRLTDGNGNGFASIGRGFDPIGVITTSGANGSVNFQVSADYSGAGLNGGYAAVCDENSIPRVSMGIKGDQSGVLTAEGSVEIVNSYYEVEAEINSNEIKLSDGYTQNPVARMAKYSGSNQTGEVRFAGENSFLNVFAGPNFRNNDLSAGLVGVADQQGDIQGGVECLSDGTAHLFGNRMSLYDSNGNPSIAAYTDGTNNGQLWTLTTSGGPMSYMGTSSLNPGTGMFAIYNNSAVQKASWFINGFTGRSEFHVDGVVSESVSTEEVIVNEVGSANVRIGSFLGAADFGALEVFDNNNTAQAGIFVDPLTNQGTVWGDTKNFRMDHPTDASKDIVYASLEGPEAAAYSRGTSRLESGKIFVEFPEHYKLLANPETMTIQLTPLYSNTIGLAVVEKTQEGFWVEERMGGTGSFSFDWNATCVRKGYEDFKVIRDK